jgi:NAD(P) transhydrogenase subunit alpha
MMMTSAGMARPAKVIILGVGVAGLQAIATARRLGAQVEAFDIRPEVKEQILSLGAKFLDLKLGETEGSASGGYAKELSAEAKARQQAALTQQLKKFDVIITTANVPGRRALLCL